MNTTDHLQLKQEMLALLGKAYRYEWSHISGKSSFGVEGCTINYGELL